MPIASPQPSLSKAALWMAGWLSLMVVIAVAGRQAARELSVFQIMLMRSVIGIGLLYPLIHAHGGFMRLGTQRFGQHAARNAVHYAAQYGWFVALTMIPLAQVVAIEFTNPLWTVLLAALFLGEPLHRFKVAAVVLGLVGVALIVRPDFGGAVAAGALPGAGGAVSATGQLIALAAALGFAVSIIMVKSLTRTDEAVVIMFWMLVVQSAIGLVPALLTWRWPSQSGWGWVLLVAFCGTYSHYCMTRAMRHAEATVVVPMDFLRVPLSALAGWAVYAERIDLLTVAGTGLILGANLLNLRRRPG